MLSKFFELVKKYQSDIIIAIIVSLMTYSAYNVGKIVAFNSLKSPITIEEGSLQTDIVRHDENGGEVESTNPQKADLSVVASSKSKSMLYHFKWCPGAGQISPANLKTFPNEANAIAAGYKLASNCSR
jgi:hypothetical protein